MTRTPLYNVIADQISVQGEMPIDEFMGLALFHDEYGYYTNADPFGTQGDFITAPDISQIFGELIALCVMDMWQRWGQPSQLTLLELGAGRGTLMQDMMRTLAAFPDLAARCHIVTLEKSPKLQNVQRKALRPYETHFASCTWGEDIDGLDINSACFFVGNEILDAIPIKQFKYQNNAWHEQVVTVEGGALQFSLRECVSPKSAPDNPNEGDVFEISQPRTKFMDRLLSAVKGQLAAGLLFDYGHEQTAYGDTLQAVYRHEYCKILDHVGQADISAHVDFDAMMRVAQKHEHVQFCKVSEQGAFLSRLGGAHRAQQLASMAKTQDQAKNILDSYERLRGDDKMGRLFKVMGIGCGGQYELAGF